jgi:hypothetical protein
LNDPADDPDAGETVDNLLPEYVLGVLGPGELERVDQALSLSEELRCEAEALTEALVAGLVPALPVTLPSQGARARLLDAIAGPDRFAPFMERLCHLLDLPRAALRELLARIDDVTAWSQGYAPGLSYFNFAPGPSLAGADAGFVRLAVGARFPQHRHLDDEVTLILEGAMRDGAEVYGPGALIHRARDTQHDYATEGTRELVLVSLHRGIVPV